MPQYLISVYDPDSSEEVVEAVHVVNREMIAAGVRRLACGLGPATALRTKANGEVVVSDGPYLEAKEHVGGFWIVETADLDEALGWARKGAKACRASAEVREMLFFVPAPEEG